jgi:hypothetical protein
MAWDAVIAAASGLGGAWLGGWLTSRGTISSEDKRQAFQREQDDHEKEAAILRATRLVFDELSRAAVEIQVALRAADDEFTWPPRDAWEAPQESA